MVAQYGNAVADDLMSDPVTRRAPLAEREPMALDRPSTRYSSQVRRAPNASGLYDVLDLILDKGIVIDAFVRVSLVGIELLTVDLRVVIASVDTYLRYAEGVERLDITNRSGAKRLPDMVGGGMKKGVAAYGAKKIGDAITGGDDEDDNKGKGNGKSRGIAGALTKGVRNIFSKVAGSDENDDDQREDDDQGAGEEDEDRAEAREGRQERGREDRGGDDRGRGNSRTLAKAGSRR